MYSIPQTKNSCESKQDVKHETEKGLPSQWLHQSFAYCTFIIRLEKKITYCWEWGFKPSVKKWSYIRGEVEDQLEEDGLTNVDREV